MYALDSPIIEDIQFRMGVSYSNSFREEDLVPAQRRTLTVTRDSILDVGCDVNSKRLRRFQSSLAELGVDSSIPFSVCLGDGGKFYGTPPVFASSRAKGCDGVVLWPAMVNRASTTSVVYEAMELDIPWEAKIDRCVWRGTTSGGIGRKNRSPGKADRLELVRKYRNHPEFDIGFSRISQAGENMATELMSQGLVRGVMTRGELLRHKYLICVEGNTFSGQMMWAAACRSLLLMPIPNWETVISKGFDPWTHYVPLSNDFSDLEEKVAWCRQHDDRCQKIVARARSHTKAYIDPERERTINEHIIRIYRSNVQ